MEAKKEKARGARRLELVIGTVTALSSLAGAVQLVDPPAAETASCWSISCWGVGDWYCQDRGCQKCYSNHYCGQIGC